MPQIPTGQATRTCCGGSDAHDPHESTSPASTCGPTPPTWTGCSSGEHHDPHSILGAHEYDDHTVIRALRPNAVEVVALDRRRALPVHPRRGRAVRGRACRSPTSSTTDSRSSYPGGDDPSPHRRPTRTASCPRSASWTCTCSPRVATSGCGTCSARTHAASRTPDGVVEGVSFAVWAPNAKGVSLIGDFNHWDGNEAPMRVLGSTGVWELFWPDFPVDGLYKFRVHGADGSVTDRADPMAFATEVPPQTASRVTKSDYTWDDDDWMARARAEEPGVRADEHLRGAPDVVAARPELSRARRRAHRVRRRAGLHPRRVAAGRRAPVRRVVGLPGHVVLRTDVAARHARRLPLSWSTRCTRRASA